MTIFFDLDGTLIDSKVRLYSLFQKLVPECTFTFDEYWKLKRDKIDHAQILRNYYNYNDFEFDSFSRNWLALIETKEYLDLDKPFNGVFEFLEVLKESKNTLYLVTARQLKSGVQYQLNKFGWGDLFSQVLVTEQKFSKDILISQCLDRKNQNWIIGDTAYDVMIGKKLGIKTAAVLSGFLSMQHLVECNPDQIIESVTSFNPY